MQSLYPVAHFAAAVPVNHKGRAQRENYEEVGGRHVAGASPRHNDLAPREQAALDARRVPWRRCRGCRERIFTRDVRVFWPVVLFRPRIV